MVSATVQTAGPMIDCSMAGAHLLGSCHSPQLPHVEEIKQRRIVQPGEGRRSSSRGQPLKMLDGQCPRVVETREPATETTLEDVLARNLSIHAHTGP